MTHLTKLQRFGLTSVGIWAIVFIALTISGIIIAIIRKDKAKIKPGGGVLNPPLSPLDV